MVRLIPVEIRGKVTWVEDAPAECAEGHRELVPTWGACPDCGGMGRQWVCRAEGCEAPTQLDDEHECGAGR